MTLKKYRDKRKFQETPEPAGGQDGGHGPLRFVVQLHRATRLHFDFRLELDGTLKSWAVPKGPSLDPQERRLAVMVEDHPLEYESFEGIIPRGNYGAGTVMVWDNGTYYSRQTPDREESERLLLDGLKKGHITFILEGKKLKGEFALVRLKRGEENAWLLLKKGDAFANSQDILEFDRSVLSNRSLDEIAKQAAARQEVWHGKPKASLPDLGDSPPSEILRQVKPMLATSTARPFDRAGWLFEIKWDGYRAIARLRLGECVCIPATSFRSKNVSRRLSLPCSNLAMMRCSTEKWWCSMQRESHGSNSCKTTRRAGRAIWSIAFSICSIWPGTTCGNCRWFVANRY